MIIDDDVTIPELKLAENLWLRDAQKSLIKDEKMSQLAKSLKLYQDKHSLLRSRTRLSEAKELKYNVKFPIVLLSNNCITQLIILDIEVLHMKTEATLNRIRTKLWIICGRQTVKRCRANVSDHVKK